MGVAGADFSLDFEESETGSMKVLVTGCTGQLGYDVCRLLREKGIEHAGVSSQEFDLTDRTAVAAYIGAYLPDTVIHCAAYTKVDLAEEEQERCMAVNAQGAASVAQACKDCSAKLIYPSTDYVFSGAGERPYETGDSTGPQNTYGLSKLAGEHAVRETLAEHFIVRISWVFGVNGNNFVKTMRKLGLTRSVVSVVDDQIGSPTYTADLAPLLFDMAQSKAYGTYHATNEGFCSWAELAAEVFYQANMDVAVNRIATAAYPAKASRPLNSRLSKASLDAGGFPRLPDWKDAVTRFLKELDSQI